MAAAIVWPDRRWRARSTGVPTIATTNLKLDVLRPNCNIDTVLDSRGIILTWLPQDRIAEFNLIYFRPDTVRGNHYHPEFDEYLLIVSGEGVLVWKESEDAPEHVEYLARGGCVRAPAGLIHAFHATMETTAIAMITKPWDECETPLIRVAATERKAAK